MNKREFLAVGGAVPLVLAGCGGSSGSAPVRLVNASVDYPNLGFMVESTQATSSDIAYGAASVFESVEAGSVDVTLTVSGSAAASAQTRTINKDTRYSLIAYGFTNELKSVLITESTTTPDDGKANVNVLNTSTDIGSVDIWLSTSSSSRYVSEIGTSVSGVSQSAFSAMTVDKTNGTAYYITVVGANSVSKGISDVRFQSDVAYTFTNEKVYTIILTPGESGVLANVIVLQQGTAGTATSYENSTARVRAVTAVGTKTTSVVGVNSSSTTGSTVVNVLTSSSEPKYSDYFVVNTGAAPTVTVDGATIVVKQDTTATDGTVTTATAVLAAGGDYTLMIYLDSSGNPIAKVVLDKNTAPVSTSGGKFRLINLASDNQGLELSMAVNANAVATNIPYGTASAYTDISAISQSTETTVKVTSGSTTLETIKQFLAIGNIYTEIVVSVPPSNPTGLSDFFLAATTTA
jgi:hypothetical protein